MVRNVDGRMAGQAVNLKEAVGGVKTNPFYLRPRDVVYVPRTRIVNVDQWVRQHLWKLLPSVDIGATIY